MLDLPETTTFLIGGARVTPTGATTSKVINPSTEELIVETPSASEADVDLAVSAARDALPGWAAFPASSRADYLDAIADALESRADNLAAIVMAEIGMPAKLARRIQVDLAISDFRTYATEARRYEFETREGNSVIRHVPKGAIGAITPWNYPLHQIAGKVGGALAAGCTVVLKPSDVAPLTACVLAEVAEEVSLPAGVLNIILGPGRSIGEALVNHPGIDMISFTGSPAAGTRVAELAGRGLKSTALELGGKSASVLLPDLTDEAFAKAIRTTVSACFLNSGQTCSGLTRLLVPQTRLAEAEQAALAAAESFEVGGPDDAASKMGPVISARQRETIRDYITTGEHEGAKLIIGGTEPPINRDKGYFVRPTIFSDTTPEMTIVQEEIFGPVLTIQAYSDVDDAVSLANGTPYSLAGAVFGNDQDSAYDVAWRMRAGQVDVNGARFNPSAPFGGFGMSGHGREFGAEGIAEFLTARAVQLPVVAQ